MVAGRLFLCFMKAVCERQNRYHNHYKLKKQFPCYVQAITSLRFRGETKILTSLKGSGKQPPPCRQLHEDYITIDMFCQSIMMRYFMKWKIGKTSAKQREPCKPPLTRGGLCVILVINKSSERVRESGKNYIKKFLKKRRDLQKKYVYVYRSKKNQLKFIY